MARTNQELTRRLGEARSLTGERQTAATYDIMQQMLKEQAALNAYLVRARTAWTGDLEGVNLPADDEYWNTGQPVQPAAAPGTVTTNPAGANPPGSR